ncbi:alpha/beta fold hydrolase [Longispora albida]|uniref:alpha/beta fold hydrolase n=1 Tax=Longispora albida TaxID=203523 RepID=UPI0003781A04|nr:alpha/beta hydrolase [Longispora albida]
MTAPPFTEQGAPDGFPVVFVHGLGDSHRAFEPVLTLLPDALHAYAYTSRGHGDAGSPPGGYTVEDFALELGGFLDSRGLEAALLAGASSGGLAVQRFAIDHPERVLGIVFLGAPCTLHGNPAVEDTWDSVVSRLTDPVPESFARDFQAAAISRPIGDFFEVLVAEALKLPARVWKATFLGLMADESCREAGRITAPVLAIWGALDPILTRAGQEARVAAIRGARLLVYEDAGHAVYWEVPGRVAADVAAFAAGCGA